MKQRLQGMKNKKIIISIIAIVLCLCSLVGIGWAYNTLLVYLAN